MKLEVVDGQGDSKPESNKKFAYISLIAASASVVIILMYYWYVYSESHITTDNAFVESNMASVNSRVMGFVKEVYVQDNAIVKKDDVLALFDDTDFNVELSFKKAKLDKARSDYQRARQLNKSAALSHSDFEAAKANLDIQQADYDGTILKLKYTKILAPEDGIIAKRNVNPGQFVQPGQSLFALVSNEAPWIRANYKETQLEKIKIGMPVEIKIDAFAGKKFFGKVESISPTSGSKLSLLPPENATGNYTKVVQKIPIKIRITNAENLLKPGMSATTTIIRLKK